MIGKESSLLNDESSDSGSVESGLQGESGEPDANIETESLTNIIGIPAFPPYMKSTAVEEKRLD
ncbi:hypothetical protein ACCT14_10385 [Rhizobium brockwellii]|uniref:hypothetical protein n=1 Tax=Rhizobium brockwellii TaxID=3019932 RepID=UPI003F9B3C88